MADELTIESITSGDTAVDPESLSDEQRSFLTSKAADLPDDVAEKYGIEKPINPFVPEPIVTGKQGDGKDGEGDDDDDDDFTPTQKVKIAKLVDSKVSPYIQQTAEQRSQLAVDSFIRENSANIPNVAKFREAMLKTSKIDGYQHLPAQALFNIVAGPELIRLGAAKERAAAAKAKSTIINNSSGGRGGGKAKDWSTASKEEFEAKKNELLGRQGA